MTIRWQFTGVILGVFALCCESSDDAAQDGTGQIAAGGADAGSDAQGGAAGSGALGGSAGVGGSAGAGPEVCGNPLNPHDVPCTADEVCVPVCDRLSQEYYDECVPKEAAPGAFMCSVHECQAGVEMCVLDGSNPDGCSGSYQCESLPTECDGLDAATCCEEIRMLMLGDCDVVAGNGVEGVRLSFGDYLGTGP